MYLVNNRFRIIKKIQQDILLSSFTAIDIVNNKQVQLNLVNSDQLTDNLKTYFYNEFSIIKNIDSLNIIKLYDFESIYSIDNKRIIDVSQYYYTSEAFEADSDISYWLKNYNEEKLISVFVQICQSINYLHLKGFFYNALNPHNILISQKSDTFKLIDFATIKLDRSYYWTVASKYLYFRAPEINKGEAPSVYSDIYSLGVLLSIFMKRDLQDDMDVYEEFDVSSNHLFHKLIPVVKKMISKKPEDRYKSIFELITDINKALSKNFLSYRKQELEKLNMNIKLVGRQFEIDTVMKCYKSVLANQDEGKFIFIHGETGIGKSRLLGRLNHLLCFDKANVYYSMHVSPGNNVDYKPVYEILKQFISESDSDILSRYENELVKFVPELGENKNILPTEPLNGDMEKFRLMNRILSFIFECSKSRTLILIIDDIHLADEFTIELIQYIYSRKSKNILFILSYSDSYNHSRKMANFLSEYRKSPLTVDITLRELSPKETQEMVSLIIFHPNSVDMRLVSKIYENTYGNPQFTLETIKNLYTKGIIYVNDQGLWLTDYNFDDMPLPINMEQAVLSQIKNLDQDSLRLLGNLSIFNSAVPLAVLRDFDEDFINNVERTLNFLLNRGLLCEKIEDFGYSYDFSNSILKKIIYSRLETNDRLNMHEKAARLLQNFYKSGRIGSEELIYHLEKCGRKDSIIKYCIANADLMEKLKNREEVIKNLVKALSVFEAGTADKVKIDILIRLAGVYYQDGNLNNSLNYFKMAEEEALKLNDFKRLINISNKIFNLYHRKADKENCNIYADKVENILDKVQDNITENYMEEYLDYKRNRLGLLAMNKEHEKAYYEAQKLLELCSNKHLKQKASILYSLGNICLDSSKEEEALSYYKQCFDCSEKLGYWVLATNSLNNIGVIYGDYYQDYVKALETYHKLKDITEKNNLIVPEALSLINLGDCYSYLLDYRQSYKYFKQALEVALKSEYEDNIYYCYTYLINTCLNLGLYKEAWEYYNLDTKYIQEHNIRDCDMDIHFQVCAVLYYVLFDMDNAEIMVKKAIEAYGNSQSIQSLECKLLYHFINIYKDNSIYSINENLQTIDRLIDSYSFDIGKINAAYDTAILLIDVGAKELLGKYVKLAEETISNKLHKKIEAKRLYIKGIIDDSDKKLEYLKAALRICNEEDMAVLKYKVFTEIGEYYLKNDNKYYAVNYYFEACEIIKKLTHDLPKEIQLQYMKKQSALLPFNRLLSMNHNNMPSIEINSIDELNSLFNHNGFKYILTDRDLKNSARKIYCSDKSYQFESIDDLLTRLGSSGEKDFITICKYLSGLTLATQCLLVIDNHNGEFNIFSASESSELLPETKNILDRARSEMRPIMITSVEVLSKNKKAVICIPIVQMDTLVGYVYMESEKIVNDFNEESLKECMKLNGLISLLIEKYQLKISSSVDVLTGTLTRKAMEETLEKTIKSASLTNSVFSVIMLDLDYFKSINDRFGHQTGDMVLQKVCRIILDNLTESDTCGRYGGEEFVIILPDTDLAKACNIAEYIIRKVEGAKILGDKSAVTISMGLAVFPSNGQMSQELIEKADQALYMAKKAGRNRYQIWEEKFSNKANVTNILSGILTGNAVQDYRNVSVIAEFINLIKLQEPKENKIYKFLGRIIEITEAQTGMLFIVENDNVVMKYARKLFSENWCSTDVSNKTIIYNVIESKQGVCYIDWDEVNAFDPLTGVPDWPSVIIMPLINSGILKGILYLSVPVRKKEFKFSDYNFVENLSQIATAIL